MRSIELCAGHGGGLLGNLLLGHTTVCAVEREPACITSLRARQAQGHLPEFPIHDDVRTFDGRPWRGSVDILSGGIPCQGFSGAGKQLGEFDPRNLWPDALRILKECRAPWFFLENVDRLTSFDYWGVILQDLATAGYDARWCVLSAGDVGAPHLRKRIWLLATDTDAFRLEGGERSEPDVQRGRPHKAEQAGVVGGGEHDSDAQRMQRERGGVTGNVGGPAPTDQGAGGQRQRVRDAVINLCADEAELDMGDSDRIGRERGREESAHTHAGSPGEERGATWRVTEPDVGGMADGLPHRLDRPEWWAIERGLPRVAGKQPHRADRLRGCGNGQVPLCKAVAWKLLGGP